MTYLTNSRWWGWLALAATLIHIYLSMNGARK